MLFRSIRLMSRFEPRISTLNRPSCPRQRTAGRTRLCCESPDHADPGDFPAIRLGRARIEFGCGGDLQGPRISVSCRNSGECRPSCPRRVILASPSVGRSENVADGCHSGPPSGREYLHNHAYWRRQDVSHLRWQLRQRKYACLVVCRWHQDLLYEIGRASCRERV